MPSDLINNARLRDPTNLDRVKHNVTRTVGNESSKIESLQAQNGTCQLPLYSHAMPIAWQEKFEDI
jgi:hypothetical protein